MLGRILKGIHGAILEAVHERLPKTEIIERNPRIYGEISREDYMKKILE